MEFLDLFKNKPLSKGLDVHRVVECDDIPDKETKSPEENLAKEVGSIINQIASHPIKEAVGRDSNAILDEIAIKVKGLQNGEDWDEMIKADEIIDKAFGVGSAGGFRKKF
jgi:hypothetical protein